MHYPDSLQGSKQDFICRPVKLEKKDSKAELLYKSDLCLHIPAAIGNHHDVDILGDDPIDEAVGLDKKLTVLACKSM